MGFKDRNRLLDMIVRDPKEKGPGPSPRRRTRSDVRGVYVPTWHSTHHPLPLGTQTIYFNQQARAFTLFEQINDVVGDRKGEHPVDHVLCVSKCGSRTPFTYTIPSSPIQSGGSGFGPWESVEFPHIHDKVPVVDSSSLGSQAQRAIQRACDLVPPVVQLPNFLWELRGARDLPDAFEQLKAKWRIFDSYQANIPRSLARYMLYLKRPDIIRDLRAWITGKRLANAFLAKSFGIDPFLSDVKKLFSILQKYDKQIAFLKSKMGKHYRVGHREELDVPAGLMNPSALGTTTLECEYYRATVNFSFEVSHDIPELDSLRSKIGAAMTMLGLGNPGAVLWEAVPYSFLVDWFVDVQGLIAHFGKLPLLEGKITVHKVSTSVTQRASVAHYVQVHPSNSKVKLDTYHIRRYWRLPELPSQNYVTLKGALTDNQLLLAAALARQRFR